MTEKTKPRKDKALKEAEEKPETGDESSWSRDQQEKSYYYDDECGYEVYNPDEDDEED
ncbi:MAG TPA: hypothetical protein VF599_04545 [Pyrinomonadaceae bacterium]|jgi:hypothetical protein